MIADINDLKAERNQLRALLDDATGKLHLLQSMMHEAGFPMRVKLGEDLHGNEDWARVRPERQLRDLMDALEIARAKAGMTMGNRLLAPAGHRMNATRL